MLKNLRSFLKKEKAVAKSFWLTLFIFVPAIAFSQESTAPPLTRLPESKTDFVQALAPQTKFQIGDRIQLFSELPLSNRSTGSSYTLRTPEGGSPLNEQGWYLDPSVQIIQNTLRFTVSPLEAGSLTLPTLEIIEADSQAIARTQPITLTVEPHQSQSKPEMTGVIEVELPLRYRIFFLLGVFALFAAIFLLVRRQIRKRKLNQKLRQKPKVIDLSAHEIALQSLSSLYLQYTASQIKPVAFGVSDALKKFFSERFRIDATESTTLELIALLKTVSIDMESVQEIRNLFDQLDQIKFTNIELTQEQRELAYRNYRTQAEVIIRKWAIQGIKGQE